MLLRPHRHQLLEPLRRFQKPLQDLVGPVPYVVLQQSNDAMARHGRSYYTKTGFVKRLEPALVDTLISRTEEPDSVPVNVLMFHCGGVMGRIRPDATAYLQREARHGVIVQTIWDDPAKADACVERARSVWRDVTPFIKGFYTNITDESQQRIRENYGANLERLIALKDKYDPTNLFRLNANVAPSRGTV